MKVRFKSQILVADLGRGNMQKRVVLKDEKILDSWPILIENAQDKMNDAYNYLSWFIQDSQAPGVKTEFVRVSPGALAGIFGRERNYLMVTNEGLRDYKMYIGARDYGKNLDVSWYLTCEPGLFKSTLSNILTKGASDKALSFMLDIFNQQDLIAYATLIHHCLLKSVTSIMQSLNQDPTSINRKSRGFLRIS